jgi:hypothetical protein
MMMIVMNIVMIVGTLIIILVLTPIWIVLAITTVAHTTLMQMETMFVTIANMNIISVLVIVSITITCFAMTAML